MDLCLPHMFPKSSFTRKHSPHKTALFDLFSCAFQVGFSSHLNGHIHSTDILHPYIYKCSPSVSIDKYCQTNIIHISSLGPICSSSKSLYLSSKGNFLQLGSIIGDKPNQENYILFLDRLSKNVTWPKFSPS